MVDSLSRNRMNILFLCEEYPPGFNGGIGTMVCVLGKELVRQGHSVFVAGLYLPGYGEADYAIYEGVKVWRIRYYADIGIFRNRFNFIENFFRKVYAWSGLLHLDTVLSTRKYFRFVKTLIEEYQIDVIEMSDWNSFLHNRLTHFELPDLGKPLVVKLNGSGSYFAREMGQSSGKNLFKLESALLEKADRLASASKYTARKTKDIFHCQKDITILHNAIPVRNLNNIEKDPERVIFTGALIFKKGIFSLLKAWNLVADQCPNARLHIYGKGPVAKLKGLLGEKARRSVSFHGHVQKEVLQKALESASIAVLPSYAECFAFAPMEAMEAGCAVIGSSRGSGPELITNGVNGILADPDDFVALSDAIIRLYRDMDLRSRLSISGWKTIKENYNIVDIASRHITFYQSMLHETSQIKSKSFV